MSSIDNMKISLQDILLATNKFAEPNIIARGGFGKVYRGQSEQHGILAIKRLDRVHGQGDREFGVEIHLLTFYKHENLVSLVGFCEEGGEKILVYKYETNESLDKVLHDTKDLTWERRLQICLDAARGLRYLHHEIGAQHRVIHRDIKSANILLDENWKAKISDFGLSKIVLANVPHSGVYTDPCGTRGYVDPQLIWHGRLTQKSDVYSFGVVLFEVLFGKLVRVRLNLDDHHFTVEMAKNHYEEKTLDKIIDPGLRNQMTLASLTTFSSIAYQCLKNSRDERPTMRLVVEELEKALGHRQEFNLGRHKASSSGYLYDVYICAEYMVTSAVTTPLRDCLQKERLSDYKDNANSGEPECLRAIEQSKSFIIVFTFDFADKTKRLNEVAKIMKRVKQKKLLVIPVFYYLNVPQLREQKGIFWKQLSKHDSHWKMEEWKKALLTAFDLPYFSHPDYGDNVSRKIAKEIKAQLSKQFEESHDRKI